MVRLFALFENSGTFRYGTMDRLSEKLVEGRFVHPCKHRQQPELCFIDGCTHLILVATPLLPRRDGYEVPD